MTDHEHDWWRTSSGALECACGDSRRPRTPAARGSATIHIPLAMNPLSLNGRQHWRVKAKHTKQWREFAGLMAKGLDPFGTCDVTLTWFVTTSHRRDEDNLYPLLKALCDGLVDAGITADDTPDLMGKTCRIQRAPAGTKTAFMQLEIAPR